jgi:RNA-directed DNA polymerase
VVRPSARKFLGFRFTSQTVPRRRIAPQALARFASRVRQLTRRTKASSLEQTIERLSLYLTGGRGYFGFCQTASVWRDLEGWIWRRRRSLAWAQWRSGRRRYRALRQYGISMLLAATTATAARAHGPWRLSRHPVLQAALPATVFAARGLPALAPAA